MERLFLETVERLNNRVLQMEKSKGSKSGSSSREEFVIEEDTSVRILPPLPSKYINQGAVQSVSGRSNSAGSSVGASNVTGKSAAVATFGLQGFQKPPGDVGSNSKFRR
jgi:hypothetical protein